MSLTPCMGGWCTKRQHCANYHAASELRQPEERMCPPGNDGAGPRNFSVDNLLHAKNGPDTLNWLFPSASPAGTPADALSPAGGPPLPRNPDQWPDPLEMLA